MHEERYQQTKRAVLGHIEQMFKEMEEDMVMSHQEKFALLEDLFENASDSDELRVAFEQWYSDHAEELQLDQDLEELWEQATMAVEE
jgi:hypothetical protein